VFVYLFYSMTPQSNPSDSGFDPRSQGFSLWFTGLSGAGKSTIAEAVTIQLRERGHRVEVLDGDEVREHLSRGLTFSKEDRDINVRRIGWIASILARNGVVAITAAISPYRATRNEVRSMHDGVAPPNASRPAFIEIHIATPLEVCEDRDVKGLYAKARSGEIPEFTGVSDPYEAPEKCEITIPTQDQSVEESAAMVLAYLDQNGLSRAL
jgi:adenylylsulfate kinase